MLQPHSPHFTIGRSQEWPPPSSFLSLELGPLIQYVAGIIYNWKRGTGFSGHNQKIFPLFAKRRNDCKTATVCEPLAELEDLCSKPKEVTKPKTVEKSETTTTTTPEESKKDLAMIEAWVDQVGGPTFLQLLKFQCISEAKEKAEDSPAPPEEDGLCFYKTANNFWRGPDLTRTNHKTVVAYLGRHGHIRTRQQTKKRKKTATPLFCPVYLHQCSQFWPDDLVASVAELLIKMSFIMPGSTSDADSFGQCIQYDSIQEGGGREAGFFPPHTLNLTEAILLMACSMGPMASEDSTMGSMIADTLGHVVHRDTHQDLGNSIESTSTDNIALVPSNGRPVIFLSLAGYS